MLTTTQWVLISFVLFMALLVYLGIPEKITKMLDARAERIREQLTEARAAREAAQKILADFEAKRAEAESDAEQIVQAAKREAELAAKLAKEDIAKSVEQRIKVAEERIAQAQSQAEREVLSAGVNMAIAATTDVIGTSLEDQAANDLIEESIAHVAGNLR